MTWHKAKGGCKGIPVSILITILFISLLVPTISVLAKKKGPIKKQQEAKEVTANQESLENKQGETVKQEKQELDVSEYLTAEEKENYYRQARVRRRGKFAFGISIGVMPDVGNMSESGPNLRKISGEMSRVTSLYNKTPATSVAGYKSNASVDSTSKSAVGFPISFFFSYYTDFFMYRSGFSYVFSNSAINQLSASQSVDSSASGNASGLNTNGKELKLTSKVKMTYFEVPFTMALRLVNIRSSSIYFGGGPSIFMGGWRRESIKNNAETVKVTGNIPDVDSFFSAAIGYHFVIGGEVFISPDIALTAEIIISQAVAGSAKDTVISRNSDTLRTDNPESAGAQDDEAISIGALGVESGNEVGVIQFGGIGISIGFRYIL